jgi:tetratricopeptide (TPR) repeat protein
MSGAVFLSYASQDAEAAKRICEALRNAGVEVWFDQSELVGGDVWDKKIRRQIKECALFLPVISANTQAREEGYFRLEWLLAVERSRLMADDARFLFPVVIDEIPEVAARVPDRFREVQWTRLDVRETPQIFAKRIARLLGQKSAAEADPPENGQLTKRGTSSPKAATHRNRLPWLVGSLLIGAGLVLALILRQHVAGDSTKTGDVAGLSTSKPPDAIPAWSQRDWPHDPDLKRAIQMIDALDSTREDFDFAEEIAQRAVDKSPSDPEAVTVLARVENQYLLRSFDKRPERLSLAKRYADRALHLAPDEPEALYAQAIFMGRQESDLPQAEALLHRACELDPKQPSYWRELATVVTRERPAEGMALEEQNVVRFPNDALTHYDLSILYRDADRLSDTERELDATIRLAPVSNAFDWKARLAFMHGNLAEMKTWIDRVPSKSRSEERTVMTRFVYAATSGNFDEGLIAVRSFTEPWFLDSNNYTGPTALLAAELISLEGKPELARLEYEAALTEVQRHLADNPADFRADNDEVWILRGLGRIEDARTHNRTNLETIERPYRPFPLSLWWFTAIPASLLLGEHDTAMQLMREAVSTPERRDWLRVCLRLDPRMAPWRDEPAIKALLIEPTAGGIP